MRAFLNNPLKWPLTSWQGRCAGTRGVQSSGLPQPVRLYCRSVRLMTCDNQLCHRQAHTLRLQGNNTLCNHSMSYLSTRAVFSLTDSVFIHRLTDSHPIIADSRSVSLNCKEIEKLFSTKTYNVSNLVQLRLFLLTCHVRSLLKIILKIAPTGFNSEGDWTNLWPNTIKLTSVIASQKFTARSPVSLLS